jgi:hypothetical protein
MNQTTSDRRLPSQPPVRFAFASASKAQLRYLWAAVAVCAAMIAATPAYGDSRTDHKKGEAPVIGYIQLDDRAQFDDRTDIAVSKTVLPHTKTLMGAWVAYYPSSCVEAAPGSWKVNKLPKYGNLTVTGLTSHLANNLCPGKEFRFDAVYYTWTKTKVNGKTPKTDAFAATWSYKTLKEAETFSLKLK